MVALVRPCDGTKGFFFAFVPFDSKSTYNNMDLIINFALYCLISYCGSEAIVIDIFIFWNCVVELMRVWVKRYWR